MITDIRYQNFRHFKDFVVSGLSAGINILVEPNGTGKSNFLEGIYLLGSGSSPRTSKLSEAINWEENNAHLSLRLGKTELGLGISKKTRQFQLNGKTVNYRSFFPHLNAVIFQPSDLNLLNGSPALRRTYLDRLITQIDFKYLYALSQYRKLLVHRNTLLRQRSSDTQVFDTVEDKLTEHAVVIYRKRDSVISHINEEIVEFGLSVSYKPNPKRLREIGFEFAGNIAEYLREKMRELREKEKSVGFTIIGPQRDDFRIFQDYDSSPSGSIDLSDFGSRGQQRMAIVRIKICESNIIEQEVGKKPVLLLDDVFSELDVDNQKILLNNLVLGQSFVTSTNLDVFPEELTKNSRIILR